MKFVSKHPLITVFLVFLLLNCFGFCWKEFRFLSDQERIEIAIKEHLSFVESFYNMKGSQKDWTDKHPEYRGEFVPYKDMQEFFAENPDCCQVTRSIRYSEGKLTVSMMGCLTGYTPYFVSGEFRLKYMLDGQMHTMGTSFANKISSCGTLFGMHA